MSLKLSSFKASVIYLVSLFLFAIFMFMLPFSKPTFIILFIFYSLIGLFIYKINFLISSVSLVLSLLFLQGLAYLINVDRIYFKRPLEVLTQKEEKVNESGEVDIFYYLKPNTELVMDLSYGDLYGMMNDGNESIKPVRKRLVYKTDSLGFRNYSDYTNQKYILVGDSFLVGANLTQESLLNYQLRDKYGFDSYNFSYVQDIRGYVMYIKRLEKILANKKWKAIVFLFEGNDFSFYNTGAKSVFYNFVSFWRTLPLYKVIYSLYSRLIYNLTNKIDAGNFPVFSYVINNSKVGFFRPYVKFSKKKSFANKSILDPLLAIKDKIELIIFLPTKYRVYYDFIENNSHSESLPHPVWNYLDEFCIQNSFSCIDLTDDLKKRSRELIGENLFTYDKDDTHWNRFGVEVAADIVYSQLSQLKN